MTNLVQVPSFRGFGENPVAMIVLLPAAELLCSAARFALERESIQGTKDTGSQVYSDRKWM